MHNKKVFILGAGITGLSAGLRLSDAGYKVNIIEKNEHVGGLAYTFRHGDYNLDLGPHKIFTLSEDIMKEIISLIGEELLTIHKKSRIRLNKRFINYPVGIKDLFIGISPAVGLRCVGSYLLTYFRNLLTITNDRSYQDWITNRFGKATFDLVFSPYAKKIWGDPSTLSKDLAETRIAVPGLFQMVKHMIFGIKRNSTIMSADEFYYPRDGIVTLSNRMKERIEKNDGLITLGNTVTKIHHHKSRMTNIELFNGTSIRIEKSDIVISTIPLKLLNNYICPLPPQSIIEAINTLKTRSLILVYLVLDKERAIKDNWIFFPGREYVFNRIFEQKGFSSCMIPQDKTVLCIEITCNENDPLWNEDEKNLYEMVISQLEECKLAKREEVMEHFNVYLQDVYQIYDYNYKTHKNLVMNYFDSFDNFYTIGRHGAFNYVGMADCMDMGFRTAEYIINSSLKSRETMRKAFESYIVID